MRCDAHKCERNIPPPAPPFTSDRIEIKFKLVLQVKLHENGLNEENYEINSLLIEFSVLNHFHPARLHISGCERVSYHYTWIFYWHCCISPCKFSSVIPLGFILCHFCHHFHRRPLAYTHTRTRTLTLTCWRYWWKPSSWIRIPLSTMHTLEVLCDTFNWIASAAP